MTHENKTLYPGFFSPVFFRRLIIGYGIGLAVICYFIFSVDDPSPEWPEYWRIRPLILTPVATAAGSIFFHMMRLLGNEGGWKNIFAAAVGTLGFIISLWLGIVLGLNGTMWN